MTTDYAAIENLESRLQRGWELIERAQSESDDDAVSRYTNLWMSLLADYERLAQQTSTSSGKAPQD